MADERVLRLLPAILALLSVGEVLVRGGDLRGGFAAVLLLAPATTLPLFFVLGSERVARAGAALGLSAAGVLALVPFGALTVAGVVAQLSCGCWRKGSRTRRSPGACGSARRR
ncbi:hypothetical protein [Streptomyces colonosanans]|uniref:Uncharacterized protein n=1 Tax=Streptomyces colonosanans TaxID=1428652 RepID=A0A1S2PPF1_9ACTN|nr:hypothetical protein [Streptomyces colonosanans]OIJ95265.1 hypothetical protein BIV24_09640 [Streptomyces colonosanans]